MLGRLLAQNMMGPEQAQADEMGSAAGAMPMQFSQLLQGQQQQLDPFGQSNNAGLMAALRGFYGQS